MEGPSGEPGQGGRAVAILGQDALSMQVTDACQGRLPGFWFVQWGDVVPPPEGGYWRINGFGGNSRTSLGFAPFS